MLAIRRPGRDVANEHPSSLLSRDLLACHGQIRRFSAMAGRLAGARDVTAEEVAAAAAALVDYFVRALPIHVLDEEASLRPRLLALPEDEILVCALEHMHAEHGPIEALLADALPRWRPLVPGSGCAGADTLAALDAVRGDLHEIAAALTNAFTSHLAGEELHVFPALPRLGIEELVGIRAEMARRRRAATRSSTPAATLPP
jgi:hypothetical protein